MKSLKRSAFILFIFSMKLTMAQEVGSEDIQGVWELNWIDSGFFPFDNLLFEKPEVHEGQYIFNFEKDGILSQKLGPEGLGECPVGFFTLDKGSWKLHDGYLTLALKGDKIADYKYDYEIVYQPKIEEGMIMLSVVEVLKSVEIK